MPRYCPRCRSEYLDEAEVCWACRVQLVDRIEPAEDERVWVHLVPVYSAPDEFSALAVQRFLMEADIQGHVRSAQIPWIDGIMKNIKGYWGQVLVAAEDSEHARELVADYLRALERQTDREQTGADPAPKRVTPDDAADDDAPDEGIGTPRGE
jgi:hypothetical protein